MSLNIPITILLWWVEEIKYGIEWYTPPPPHIPIHYWGCTVCMKFKPTICAPPGEIALLIRYAQCTLHTSFLSPSLPPFPWCLSLKCMYTVEVCKIDLWTTRKRQLGWCTIFTWFAQGQVQYWVGDGRKRNDCIVQHNWSLADLSVIGASGLSDNDDGKNNWLKLRLANSFRKRNIIFTDIQLLYHHFHIFIRSKKGNNLHKFHSWQIMIIQAPPVPPAP
jgi:hypothetical protein